MTFPLNGLDRQPAAPQPEASRFADGRAFGDFLRQQRQARRVSLHEIADRTKILASRLEALERGDVRLWPTGIYRRAIVRDYASAIGLDPDGVVKEFLRLFPAPDPNPTPEPAPQTLRVLPSAVLLRLVTLAQTLARQLPRLRHWTIPRVSVPRVSVPRVAIPRIAFAQVIPSRRAWGTLGSVVVGAVLGATAAWMIMNAAPDRVEAIPEPVEPAHLSTGSIHTARLVVDSPRATTGAGAGSRFDEPLSEAPLARVTTADAPAGHPGIKARPDLQHAVETTAPAASVEGRLRVTSNVPGARVTVNGIGWGSTPLTIRHLPPGPKRIRVTKEGYRSVERTVELTPERLDLAVRLDLRPMDNP